MLSIMTRRDDGQEITTRWWIGMPTPVIPDRVVKFQADGHELELIFNAIKERGKND